MRPGDAFVFSPEAIFGPATACVAGFIAFCVVFDVFRSLFCCFFSFSFARSGEGRRGGNGPEGREEGPPGATAATTRQVRSDAVLGLVVVTVVVVLLLLLQLLVVVVVVFWGL